MTRGECNGRRGWCIARVGAHGKVEASLSRSFRKRVHIFDQRRWRRLNDFRLWYGGVVMDLGRGGEVANQTLASVLKEPKTEMTHSVNMENTGILGVGRDTSMVLGVSLKRPRAPGSLRR